MEPNLGFILHTHKNVPQVKRLVARIKGELPGSLVVVCHDRGGEPFEVTDGGRESDLEVRLVKGGRGDFSQVTAYLDACKFLLSHPSHVSWIVNLTGQCYPLCRLDRFRNQLASDSFDVWAEIFPVRSRDSPWPLREAVRRYHFRYFDLPDRSWSRLAVRSLDVLNRLQPVLAVEKRYRPALGVRRPTIFSSSLACYGGSAYRVMNRRATEYLLRFCVQRPDVLAYFESTLAPDESLVQSVLASNGSLRIRREPLHYFDFSTGRKSGSPKVLTMRDLPQIRASGRFFGRKFDCEVDRDILDTLDAQARL